MVGSKEIHNIIVIDTENSSRKALSAKLSKLQCKVYEHESAVAALELLSNIDIDLILSSTQLSDMDVGALCKAVRSQAQFKQLPILVLAAANEIAEVKIAYTAGATDVLSKSDHLDLTVQRIRYALRNSSYARDISARQHQLEQVHRVAKLGYWRFNVDDGEFYLSDEAKIIFGVDEAEFDNTLLAYLDLIHISDRDVVKASINNAIYSASPFSIDHRIVNAQGAKHYVHTQGEVVMDDHDKPEAVVGTVQDITERKRAEATIEHLALYDSLTDLCNRRLFQNRLAHSMAIAHRDEKLLAVCFFDLDNFKNINDNLGHPVGDELLRTVAKRLRNTMRHGDIVARISGDEFALAIEGLSTVAELEMIVDKLSRRLGEPYSIHGHKIFATASIGIALYPLDGADRDALMRFADAAMYRAKELGGNCYSYYTHDMSDKSRRRLDMEYKLRHALEKNELRVYYQPQVDMLSGNIIGTEALLRWVHPRYGLLPPSKFMSIAEDTGLIFPIGRWVIKTACDQTAQWHDDGFRDLHVSVNMSSRQFAEENIVNYIDQVIHNARFDANKLRVEINENVAMQYKPGGNDNLLQLKMLGAQLAIDDFGSGHSSMNHLQKLPIDALNIDRSFIMNIAEREQDGATAKAIIALAHNLGLRVVAEGVETPIHVGFLRKHACDEMQGNHFSPPVPVNKASKILSMNYTEETVSSGQD